MSTKKTILVTGGLGYIGTHTIIELYNEEYKKAHGINEEYEVIIVDSCRNSSPKMLDVLEKFLKKKFVFYQIDLCDKVATEKIFKEHKIDTIIHFAGRKSVEESVKDPLGYYHNNVISSLNLAELCEQYNVNEFIFSSTCAVYGMTDNSDDSSKESNPNPLPATPYGRTKLYTEGILKDYCIKNPNFKAVLLRYCNVVSNHHSGEIGESPTQSCTCLFPLIGEYIRGKRKKLYLNGTDWPTRDGTCIRDFIHVTDISRGHVIAMKVFQKENSNLLTKGHVVYNLGTNHGYSVKEIFDTYQQVSGLKFDITLNPRRAGDTAIICPNCEKIKKELGWEPTATLKDICEDAYNFIKKYPEGIC